jgi:hypothetical protein
MVVVIGPFADGGSCKIAATREGVRLRQLYEVCPARRWMTATGDLFNYTILGREGPALLRLACFAGGTLLWDAGDAVPPTPMIAPMVHPTL